LGLFCVFFFVGGFYILVFFIYCYFQSDLDRFYIFWYNTVLICLDSPTCMQSCWALHLQTLQTLPAHIGLAESDRLDTWPLAQRWTPIWPLAHPWTDRWPILEHLIWPMRCLWADLVNEPLWAFQVFRAGLLCLVSWEYGLLQFFLRDKVSLQCLLARSFMWLITCRCFVRFLDLILESCLE